MAGETGNAPLVKAPLISIDLVDACNLACRTCPRGRREMPNRRGQMSLDLYGRIIEKAWANGIRHVDLYNWTEPFLARGLAHYTKMAHYLGFTCRLSSNLSIPEIPDMIRALENVDTLIVSVSGADQSTYQINHRGGRLRHVIRNLRLIAQAKRQAEIQTQVHIVYFDFPYTRDEYPVFEEFALGLNLEISLMPASGNPLLSGKAPKQNTPPPPPHNPDGYIRALPYFSKKGVPGHEG